MEIKLNCIVREKFINHGSTEYKISYAEPVYPYTLERLNSKPDKAEFETLEDLRYFVEKIGIHLNDEEYTALTSTRVNIPYIPKTTENTEL